jgi:hypothetical protein
VAPSLRNKTERETVYAVFRLGVCHKSLSDGRRQILSFLLPGDLITAGVFRWGNGRIEGATSPGSLLCIIPRWFRGPVSPVSALGYDTWLSAREEGYVDDTC